MAISLNGSSQYVSLGNGVNVYAARPYTFVALVNTASLRTSGAWNALYCQGDYANSGWGVEIEAAASPRLYHTWTDDLGLHENYSSFSIGANTGWWLIMVVHRDTGSASAVEFWGYRYSTSTLSTGTAGSGGTADRDPSAPGGSDPTEIGAFNDGGVIDYFPGAISWAAIFAGDLGEVGSANPKALWEMIARGPWGMLDSNTKLFVPFSAAAQDLSGNSRHGTLVASPTYVGSGPTEVSPSLWIVPDYVAGGSGETVVDTAEFAAGLAATDTAAAGASMADTPGMAPGLSTADAVAAGALGAGSLGLAAAWAATDAAATGAAVADAIGLGATLSTTDEAAGGATTADGGLGLATGWAATDAAAGGAGTADALGLAAGHGTGEAVSAGASVSDGNGLAAGWPTTDDAGVGASVSDTLSLNSGLATTAAVAAGAAISAAAGAAWVWTTTDTASTASGVVVTDAAGFAACLAVVDAAAGAASTADAPGAAAGLAAAEAIAASATVTDVLGAAPAWATASTIETGAAVPDVTGAALALATVEAVSGVESQPIRGYVLLGQKGGARGQSQEPVVVGVSKRRIQ